MRLLDWLGDGCAVVAVTAAIYELVALVSGRRFPFLTDLVWGWRLHGNRLIWLSLVVWLGLGWHLFIEMRGAHRVH